MRVRTCTAIAALATTFGLGGCSSFPPLWPMTEQLKDYPDYPTVRFTTGAPQSCDTINAAEAATAASTAQQSDQGSDAEQAAALDQENRVLYCVQKVAMETFATYEQETRRMQAFRNGEIWTLIGLGSAVGVKTVESSTTASIRSLGLAAAGVLGLDAALGFSGQHQIYEAGTKAVGCIIDADAALDNAPQTDTVNDKTTQAANSISSNFAAINTSPPALTSYTAGEVNLLAAYRLKTNQHLIGKVAPSMQPKSFRGNALQFSPPLSLPPQNASVALTPVAQPASSDNATEFNAAFRAVYRGIHATPTKAGANENDTSVAGNITAAATLTADGALSDVLKSNAAASQLKSDLTAAVDPKTRARNLYNALVSIKQAVGDGLWSNSDPTTVYSAMKTGLQNSVSTIASSQQKTATTVNNSGTTPASASILTSLKGLTNDDSVQVLLDSVNTAANNSNSAQNITSKYQQCIAGVTGSSTNSNSTGGTTPTGQ